MAKNWLAFKKGGLPVVMVRIENERYHALFDTGAETSLIAPELSLLLGLQRVRSQLVVGVTGQRELLPVVKIPTLEIALTEIPPSEAVVRNLNPLGLNVSLILGVNAFANLRVQFDFTEGRVYLLDS